MVQRCRGTEVQRCAEAQRCRGADAEEMEERGCRGDAEEVQ